LVYIVSPANYHNVEFDIIILVPTQSSNIPGLSFSFNSFLALTISPSLALSVIFKMNDLLTVR
jgi:hypothetical protein